MKRYIRAMSRPRKKAEKHVESYSKHITDHIVECVVYKDSLDCFNHWIDEIAAWFDDINSTTLDVKRNPPKFKPHEYANLVFGEFGTTTSDTRGVLLSYKANNTKYPDFDITPQLVRDLFCAAQDLSSEFCHLFASSRGRIDTPLSEISQRIHLILDEYK